MKIIQQNEEKFQAFFNKFLEEGMRSNSITDFNLLFFEEYNKLGLELLKDLYEAIDEKILEENRKQEKRDFIVHKKVKRTLLTKLGVVTFFRRYYKDVSGKIRCLFDEKFNIKKGKRITGDALIGVISEGIETSYKKGGEAASITDNLSKTSVNNYFKEIKIPNIIKKKIDKKQVDYLYIDADEDHISLQRSKKPSEQNKIIYVYEGKEKEAPKSKRVALKNTHYFGGIEVKSAEKSTLWWQVYEYIENNYDVENIKKIYLNSDGGGWIKEGREMFPNVEFVLDEFHIVQYVNRMTNHLSDKKAKKFKQKIYFAFKNEDEIKINLILTKIETTVGNDTERNNVEAAKTYILNNIDAIFLRYSEDKNILGCSAEGHVSHVLASRMSSRPMGWTVEGANKMTMLRFYVLNGGSIYDLVKSNFEGVKAETYNCSIKEEQKEIKVTTKKKKQHKNKTKAKYYDVFHGTLTEQGKKLLNI